MEIEKVRGEFPFLKREVYGKNLIYFDNAATTQKPSCVLRTITESYENRNANVHRGVHKLSQEATAAHEQARAAVARFIGAASEREVIFTRGTTEGVNLVAQSFLSEVLKKGDEILLTQMEHHSNMVPWQLAAAKVGATVKYLPINERGELEFSALATMLSARTRLVALCHVSNVLGTVNDVKKVAEMAHEVGAYVLVDGAQAVAHTRVDVQALGADFYVFSGHKIYAPTGIGVLWGREAVLEKMVPYQSGGEMIKKVTFSGATFNDLPYRFEAGTPNFVGSVALAAALDFLEEIGFSEIEKHENSLLTYATEQLTQIDGLRVIGQAKKKSGVLSFLVRDIHPYDIGMMLDKLGIAVRTGHHCAEPLIDLLGIPGTVRASFALYNTFEEIDALKVGLERVLKLF